MQYSTLTPKLKAILGFMIISFFILLAYSADAGANAAPDKAWTIISVAILIGVVYAFGVFMLYKAHHKLQSNLKDSRDEALANERALATETERIRLAREIHDTVAQGLSSIVMLSNSMTTNQLDESSQKKVDVIKATAKENLQEARGIIKELTPTPLEGQDFSAAVERICEQSIVPMKYVNTLNQELPRATETALLRMTQSLVANVNQHSQASRGVLTLSQERNGIVLKVSDNGRGMDSDKGFGLKTIEQRAAELGGTVSIESDAGTTVTVSLPLRGQS
ncbi:MAG: sensor histidine kinase [Micrococcaceae bacterium]